MFTAGQRVALHGLVGRADLNGCTATIVHYIDASGRWALEVENAECEKIQVREANIKPLHAASSDALLTLGDGLDSRDVRKALCSAYDLARAQADDIDVDTFLARLIPAELQHLAADARRILTHHTGCQVPAAESRDASVQEERQAEQQQQQIAYLQSVMDPRYSSGTSVAASAGVAPVLRAAVQQPILVTSSTTIMPNAPAAVRGTMATFIPEAMHLSPAIGLALCSNGGAALLTSLYNRYDRGSQQLATDLAAGGDPAMSSHGGGGSYCSALCQQLFYRNMLDEPLRPTSSLSLCAAHLSASLVAHTLGLAWRREEYPDAASVSAALRRAVCSETSLTIEERKRGTVPTLARFAALVALVRGADDEAGAPLRHTGTALILHHLWLRSPSRAELWGYCSTLEDEYGPVLASGGLRGAAWIQTAPLTWEGDLAATALVAAAETLSAAEAPSMDAEQAAAWEVLAAAAAMESSYTGLPLRMGKFSFEGQMPKADCTENCARELLNTLLWCEQTRCFDAARLPASSTADLRAFYQPGGPAEQQHDAAARPMYPPSYPDVWYQMCSNHRGVQYLAGEGGRRYEAVPSIDNVCALLGVLMGLEGVVGLESFVSAFAPERWGLSLRTDGPDRLYVDKTDNGHTRRVVGFVFSPPPEGMNHSYALHSAAHVSPWRAAVKELARKMRQRGSGDGEAWWARLLLAITTIEG